MKKNRAILFIIPLFIIVLLFTFEKNSSKFNEKDFVGKTSAEIISQYGSFDFATLHPKEDGLYKKGHTVCQIELKSILINPLKRITPLKL